MGPVPYMRPGRGRAQRPAPTGAAHVRIGDPFLSQALGPFYLGVLVWGGIYLRDDRLRELIPVRS